MALNATTLGAAIKAALLAEPSSGAVDNAALTATCNAIASAVVSHITAAAIVLPALLVAPPGGGPVVT